MLSSIRFCLTCSILGLFLAPALYAQDPTAVDTTAADTIAAAPVLKLDSTQTLSPKLKELFTELATDETNAGLHLDIAKEYQRLGRPRLALKQLEESLKHDGTNMDAMYEKGQLLLHLGKRKSAYETFLAIMRDFKADAYLDRIGSQFASPYKITQLTSNKFNDAMPSFSPDGGTLIFQSDRNGNWDIFTMNLSQGESSVKPMTSDNDADENPAYSPDGRFIVFTSTRDDKSTRLYKSREIYFMDRNGKSQRRITSSYGGDNWGPQFVDTTTVLFASDRVDLSNKPFWQKGTGLFTIEKSGSFLFQVYGSDKSSPTDPSLRVNGEELVFADKVEGEYDIFMGSLDGKGTPANLTGAKGNDVQPSLSKNGLFIVYVSDVDGNYEVYRMTADGKDQTRITYDDGDDVFPKFSPDGTKIVFTSNRTGNYQLYMASVEESSEIDVAKVVAALEKKIQTATDD